jgi:hypothetical protein
VSDTIERPIGSTDDIVLFEMMALGNKTYREWLQFLFVWTDHKEHAVVKDSYGTWPWFRYDFQSIRDMMELGERAADILQGGKPDVMGR